MNNWISERENRLREFFNLDAEIELIEPKVADAFNVPAPVAAHLERFNIEWHIIPKAASLPIDTDEYHNKLYSGIKIDYKNRDYKKTSSYQAILSGHERHQGRIIGVETTVKPKYLPGNRQFYGTAYGFETKADPFAAYL